MQVKAMSAAPDSADIESMRTLVTSVLQPTEVAVALAASDMPTKRVLLTSEEAVAFAVQGVMRLGVDEVRDRAQRARNVNRRYGRLLNINGGKIEPGNPALKLLNDVDREVWGCGKRRQARAVDVAWHVTGMYERSRTAVADRKVDHYADGSPC